MSKETMTLRKFVIARGASESFLHWLGGRDVVAMWSECRRSDWMMWLLQELEWEDAHAQREYAWWCATQVRHLMIDSRSTGCLDVVRKYLDGECSEADMVRAGRAARAAAAAASDAAWSAEAWLAAATASDEAWSELAADAAWSELAADEAAATAAARTAAAATAAAATAAAAARTISAAEAAAAAWTASAVSLAIAKSTARAARASRAAQADRLRELVPVAAVQALFKQATGGTR